MPPEYLHHAVYGSARRNLPDRLCWRTRECDCRGPLIRCTGPFIERDQVHRAGIPLIGSEAGTHHHRYRSRPSASRIRRIVENLTPWDTRAAHPARFDVPAFVDRHKLVTVVFGRVEGDGKQQPISSAIRAIPNNGRQQIRRRDSEIPSRSLRSSSRPYILKIIKWLAHTHQNDI